ncbi:MAG: rhomboid family intramembrane serine protease [Deltaproteobacteria bacterium]|nr:MAG: rhomboid family intramembrane serine protease [Deltaproteobacteria bacterium]
MPRSSPWSGLPRFERGGFGIFVAAAALTALLGDRPLGAALVLDPARAVAGGEVWRILTAPFVFPDGRAGGLLLTLGVQWFLGSHVERSLGTARYLAWTLGAAVAGYAVLALVGAIVQLPPHAVFGGTLPADLAAVTFFGVRMGHVRLSWMGVLPMGARGLAAFVVGLSLLSELFAAPSPAGLIPPAVAVALAFAGAMRTSGRLGGKRRRRRKNHLRVVPPDDVRLH